ncbi:MAG: response regulator, partial [bacterium]|nr:response regulator [bacterium]
MSTILVVESDPIFGAVLEDRLHVAGHEVELLFDKERAVAEASENQVDLLIIEVAQPSSGGLEVVNALREGGATRALPILVLSESAESTDRVAALRAGVDDYLTKPCDLEELMLRAERLVGSRTALAPVLQGDLANHPLWELVQYIQQAGKSGDLVLRGSAGSGSIHLHRGKVFAARWEGFSGREALLAIFGLKQGTFRFVSDTPDGESTPTVEPFEVHELLMRAAWLEDEIEKRRRHLPGTGVPLKTTGKPVPAKEDSLYLTPLPVEEVRTLVHKRSGIRVFDLIRKLPRAPQAIRLAVAWLIEQGVLTPPDEDQLEEFPSTGEIASTMIVDMAVTEFLTAARSAGFGTSALPFLILVEPGIWPELLELLESVPGYRR